MQPFQYNLGRPPAKDHSITRTAAAARNRDATTLHEKTLMFRALIQAAVMQCHLQRHLAKTITGKRPQTVWGEWEDNVG